MGINASAWVVRSECAQLSTPPPQRVLNIRQLHARLHTASLQACPRTGLGETGPPCPAAPQRSLLPGVPSKFPPFPSAKYSHLLQAAALALLPQPCGHISLAFKALKQPHLGSSPGSPSRPLHTLPSTFKTQLQGYTSVKPPLVVSWGCSQLLTPVALCSHPSQQGMAMSPLLEGRDQSWCTSTRILAQQGRSMEGCMPNICGTKLGQGAPCQWRLWPHCLAPCFLWGWKRKILKEKLRQFLSDQPHLASAHPDGFWDLGT